MVAYTDTVVHLIYKTHLLAHLQNILEKFVLAVHTEIVTRIVGHIRTADNTFLAHISQRKGISGGSASTSDTQRIALCCGIILEHRIYPIRIIHIAVGIVNRLVLAPIVSRKSAVQGLLIHNGHILFCIQHIGLTSYILYSIISIETYLRFTFAPLLGSNKHYTISTGRTVDSRTSRIFQYIYTFNIGRIQSRNITTHTINQVKRSTISHGTKATDTHFHVSTRLTGSRSNTYTRCLSLHSLQGIGCIHLGYFVTLHLNSGTRHQFLLLDTIAHYNHFIQHFRVLLQHHIDDGRSTYLDFL